VRTLRDFLTQANSNGTEGQWRGCRAFRSAERTFSFRRTTPSRMGTHGSGPSNPAERPLHPRGRRNACESCDESDRSGRGRQLRKLPPPAAEPSAAPCSACRSMASWRLLLQDFPRRHRRQRDRASHEDVPERIG
jgi:hypothetical protein